MLKTKDVLLDETATLLVMLALFQVKHLFADFYLQTPKMLSARSVYLHVGRAQHAGVHVLGSLLVLLPFGLPGAPFRPPGRPKALLDGSCS